MRVRDRGHAGSLARRSVVVILVLGLLLVLAGGSWWRRHHLAGLFDGGDPVASASDVPAPAGVRLPDPRPPREVLAEPTGPPVSAQRVRERLAPLLASRRFGDRVGVAVFDLTHDRRVLQVGSGAYMPASTLKLATAAAALELLGPEHRFTTTVGLRRRGGAATVTLVGGGDPMLVARPAVNAYPSTASLRRLVGASVRAMGAEGVRRVQVSFDASLFTGPAIHPSWEPDYVPAVTTPVNALSVDEGIDPVTLVRSTDPAALAAELFADGLRARGIRVTAVRRATAREASAPVIASVDSPPLDDVVAHVLGVSDNEGAEILLRHVGLASGNGGSFAGGAAGVRETLTSLGVAWNGARFLDGSGLSRGNRLSLESLVDVLRLGADDEHPDLRPVVASLPVAGFDGTLVTRFFADGTSDALGLVRAKTGTLSGTHALAGTVVDADGVLLAFVAVANGVAERHTLFTRDQLDRVTAALAGCGCSR